MDVTRRDFLTLIAVAGGLGVASPRALARALEPERLLDFEALGNVTLLHMTDPHGTLLPVHYREPDTRIGVGDEAGKPAFLSGEAFLKAYRIARGSAEAHALTHLDFAMLAARYGRMGGYAHLATLVKRVRDERVGKTLLLDGGDTLQGSATALWTRGLDMVRAMNQLGVEVFTPHWEFTHGIERVKELGGVRVGVIGQAFPYVPVAHPQRFVPGLTFGIQEDHAQKLVNELRDAKTVDLVVLLSHNGLSTDVKMAGRVRGLDVVLGGHTHDGLPEPILVGRTLVINSGAHGKFLSRLDLDVRDGQVKAHRHKLMPVLSRYIPADPEMLRLIREIRAPYESKLGERLAVSESLLYRRGNFNGSFDEIILDALLKRFDAEVAFSPGFRWGVTIVPGQPITLEDVYSHTALTYPNTLVRDMTGREILAFLEDVADNLFHLDPYYRQGGDMVRVGGMRYAIDIRQGRGRRISDVKVAGRALEPVRRYRTTRWASTGEADGPPAYDVVADYLRGVKRVRIDPRP